MVKCKALVLVVLAMLVGWAAPALAVSASLWEIQSTDDFNAGEPDGASIMSPGKVVLGPASDTTILDALYGWSLAIDSNGAVYVGTGSDGKIFKVSPAGSAELFADLDLQQVFALAIDKKNVLYAGGFPGGKVYAISDDGVVREYFDSEQESVWTLCFRSDGGLAIGTGDDGKVFLAAAQGKGDLFYDSPERRIISLVNDAEGNLYAGTEQNGLIYRIDKAGRPFLQYDTELQEVTAMTMDVEGNLYAVSSPGELFMKMPPPMAVPAFPKQAQQAAAAAVAAAVQEAAAAATPAPFPGMPAVPTPKKRTCMIYRISKDGTAKKVWESPEKLIFSIAVQGDTILAGSGDEGIIYLVAPDGESGIYYQADQKQVLDLLVTDKGKVVAALGNDAAVIQFADGFSAKATYVSPVHDATAISQWGRVFWEAEAPPRTQVSFATRSGNSEMPDDTWSEWSSEHTNPFVSNSPNARYVQWRATLSTLDSRKTPALRKVALAYLQNNLPPEILSIEVGNSKGNSKGNSGGDMAKALKALSAAASGGAQADGARASKEGVKAAPAMPEAKVRINWQAQDPNDDTLEYSLFFKGTEESRWKLLEEKLSETTYEWDTEAVPDGEYHVKVIASDLPGNPEPLAHSTEKVSQPFTVDNTSPVVSDLRAVRIKDGAYRVSCTVSDNIGPVRSAHYSIDAGDWLVVFPTDRIFDSSLESVEFLTEKLGEGEHTIVIKAVDYFGNVGAGKVTIVAE